MNLLELLNACDLNKACERFVQVAKFKRPKKAVKFFWRVVKSVQSTPYEDRGYVIHLDYRDQIEDEDIPENDWQHYDAYFKEPNHNEHFALDYIEWEYVVEAPIKISGTFPSQEHALVSFLYEITWHGDTAKKVRKNLSQLSKGWKYVSALLAQKDEEAAQK